MERLYGRQSCLAPSACERNKNGKSISTVMEKWRMVNVGSSLARSPVAPRSSPARPQSRSAAGVSRCDTPLRSRPGLGAGSAVSAAQRHCGSSGRRGAVALATRAFRRSRNDGGDRGSAGSDLDATPWLGSHRHERCWPHARSAFRIGRAGAHHREPWEASLEASAPPTPVHD